MAAKVLDDNRNRLAAALANYDELKDTIATKDGQIAEYRVLLATATTEIESLKTLVARYEKSVGMISDAHANELQVQRDHHNREMGALASRYEESISTLRNQHDSAMATLRAERDSFKDSESQLLSMLEGFKSMLDGFNIRPRPSLKIVDKPKPALLEGRTHGSGTPT